MTGFIGGGQLGCNWQWGAWVFGIEGDGSATNKSGQAFGIAPFNINRIHETQERWLATARGKLGLTDFWWFGPRTLLYVTGGGAWAKVDNSNWLVTSPQSTGDITTQRRASFFMWTSAATTRLLALATAPLGTYPLSSSLTMSGGRV
jgi:opacity protein-like surface antigen